MFCFENKETITRINFEYVIAGWDLSPNGEILCYRLVQNGDESVTK